MNEKPTEAQLARYAVINAYSRAEDARDYPGRYHILAKEADQLYEDWKKNYPAEAAAEAEERAAEKALKDKRCDQSFVARNLD